ncbi:MAG: FKBP-type peptidyl-prolyl cis-trans isomerase [Desulforhopalus sp.]|jgi:peptidylprolyl isomerase/FKBP-type peptidyl-prolyl cis-trans isomerase FklB|nr:FKBP-type peptidyl-prolyl cis-trans isomerase [Desulforhopalus sp.]
MKKYLAAAMFGLLVCAPVLSFSAAPAEFDEKLSYSMGFEVGNYFKGAGDDVQKEFLILGIEDAFAGKDAALSAEEMQAVKQEFALKVQARQMAQLEEMKAANMAAGEAFLAENRQKEGVVVTESGLQYLVLQEGSGEPAKATDTVTVAYVGTLINGTEFDSTEKHGEPAQFQVDQVIPGWSEALQLMTIGSKLNLVIPSGLAYGENGAAPVIEPNSVLIFDVELLGIEGR